MYIRKEKKQGPSLFRVFVLTILILAGLWLVKSRPDWARPFEPTPVPTLPARYFINDGDIAQAEGRLHQAIQAYEQAIALEPENDLPYLQQAMLLTDAGDTARALLRAEQAVLLNPNSPQNLAGYCRTLDWEGQYAAATEACECAIELDENYAPAYAFLSEVYADEANWIPARTTAQKALEIDFQSPEAHHNMGYALEVQGRYREAVEFYENAIALRPNQASYYMAAGRNYYWLGQLDQAADRFGEAIKLNPTDARGYDQLGWTYHANGQDARAIDALEQAIKVNPGQYRAWGRLGSIYYLRQNYEEALKILPTAINLAEHQFLSKARSVKIMAQIEGPTGPESVAVVQGRFEHSLSEEAGQAGLLTARLAPIEWAQSAPNPQDATTCGGLVAHNIKNRIIVTSPTDDISFSQIFSRTTGTAGLDPVTGELSLSLANVPFPKEIPYELQLLYLPNKVESLGYFQPDGDNNVAETFTISGKGTAPVEYYYELGLSYVYLQPPQCDKAVPWLLKSLDVDPAYYNPAWAGLKICPSTDSPPTPLPTFTPTPDGTATSTP